MKLDLPKNYHQHNNVYSLFEILDLESVRDFVPQPDNEEIGREAAVIDRYIHYL